ncbi:uncharacterized protein LOC131153036 [Malania oleifera]|uniref:uncharacterized protein LOC131153036 n=1 Tax=Malania oleifera TaxID=397392 RepID=UPI0025ADC223|nr:uncharacterized protein LOC131153036 [Malania oleifera]
MVISWLINSMHADVYGSVMYCKTAREMWLELQNVFSQGNGPKIYNLQKELCYITQNQMSAIEYFTKFKRLWDQLLNLEPLPECTCGANKTFSNNHDKVYVMRFLMGLNENFETIRTQILMYEPLPSINKVYALVLQEESHKNAGHGGSYAAKPDTMAMYANSRGSSSGNSGWNKENSKKEKPMCTHCNMLGHTIDKCFKLHGYPPGYKSKWKSSANQVSCPQGTVIENFFQSQIQCPITKTQCEQLLAFLNTGSISNDNHHVANASVCNGLSRLTSGSAGVHGAAAMTINSSQPQAHNKYLETISGPCLLEHDWSG